MISIYVNYHIYIEVINFIILTLIFYIIIILYIMHIFDYFHYFYVNLEMKVYVDSVLYDVIENLIVSFSTFKTHYYYY